MLIVQELVNQFLSDHTTHIIEHVQLLIVSPLLKNLMKAARSKKTWPHKFSILRAASEYVIFDDLAEQQYPDIGKAKETMLWVHRVIDTSTIEKGFEQEFLTLSKGISIENGQAFRTVWGGSFIDDTTSKFDFVETLLVIEYLYSLLDMYSRSQRRLMRNISHSSAVACLNAVSTKFDRLENAISELINESSDYYNSLLDSSETIFDGIWNSFRAPKLIQNIEARSAMLKARIERISQIKHRRQVVFINFVLIAFGGLQLVSLALNLFWYAEVSPVDNFHGILDLVQNVSPDLTLSIGFSLIIIAACIWAYLVRREK